MQEEIDQRSIAFYVKTGKVTGRVLAAVCQKALAAWKQHRQDALTPHGKQTVKQLMGHGTGTNTIPLDGSTRLFDRMARKWNVDYAFHKVGPNKHLLLFKAGQADAITACFSEYTKRVMKQERRPSILKQVRKLTEQAKSRPRQHERKREAVRHDR